MVESVSSPAFYCRMFPAQCLCPHHLDTYYSGAGQLKQVGAQWLQHSNLRPVPTDSMIPLICTGPTARYPCLACLAKAVVCRYLKPLNPLGGGGGYKDRISCPHWAWKVVVSMLLCASLLNFTFHAQSHLAFMGISGALGTCRLWPLPGEAGRESWWPDPAEPGRVWSQWELASGCHAIAAKLYPTSAA